MLTRNLGPVRGELLIPYRTPFVRWRSSGVGKNYRFGQSVKLSWVLGRALKSRRFFRRVIKKRDLGNWLSECTLPSVIELSEAEIGKLDFGENERRRG